MALFHKWASKNGVRIGGAAPLAQESTPLPDNDTEEMSGSDLQAFIRQCVRKSLHRNLESMMTNLKHL